MYIIKKKKILIKFTVLMQTHVKIYNILILKKK